MISQPKYSSRGQKVCGQVLFLRENLGGFSRIFDAFQGLKCRFGLRYGQSWLIALLFSFFKCNFSSKEVHKKRIFRANRKLKTGRNRPKVARISHSPYEKNPTSTTRLFEINNNNFLLKCKNLKRKLEWSFPEFIS